MNIRYFVNPILKDGQPVDNHYCIVVHDSDISKTDYLYTNNNTFEECAQTIELLKVIDKSNPKVKQEWINSFNMHPRVIESLDKYIEKFYDNRIAAGQIAAMLVWQKERMRLILGAY